MAAIRAISHRFTNLLSSTWQIKSRFQTNIRHFIESRREKKMNLSRSNSTTSNVSDDVLR